MMRGLALITLTFAALAAPGVRAQAPGETGGLEARVWLDRGDEPVLRRGETVRIFYRASQNAYAAIFRIDTDGRVSLIYPQDPTTEERLTGGVDYRLILPNSPVWRVDEDPGVGYFFMVASPTRLDFSAFPFDPRYGWDLGAVGGVVYEDPYVAIDDYVAYLIPNWEETPYGLDFITYNVGDTYTYPRFLCYDCHDARPYASWNPYAVPCTSYRVVIYDDPYFYPYYRYSGMSVVVARPLVTQPRYAVAVRAPGDSYRPLVRTRPGPPRRTTAEFKEPPAEADGSGAVPRRLGADELEPARRPTLQRRPTAASSRLPVRTPPSSADGASSASPSRTPRDATIVRPNRPSTDGASPSPTRPSGSATPSPRAGDSDRARPSSSVRPGARTPASARPGARPSTSGQPSTRPSTPSRPTVRPSAPSQPSTRPSAPSRQGTRPSAPSRPSTRPSAPSRPSTRPSAPSQPSSRSPAPSRPSARPSSQGRSPQPSAPSRSSTSSRPSTSSGSSSRPSGGSRPAPSRPSGNARPGNAPRR